MEKTLVCGVCGRRPSLAGETICPYITCPWRPIAHASTMDPNETERARTCGVCGLRPPLSGNAGCAYVTCPQPPIADSSMMNGKEFELFVRDRLVSQGYANVETTPGSGDMGADLILREGDKVIVIQCKRYTGAVGLQAVQEVLGAKHFYQADEAWVITDSTFTSAAKKLARSAKVRLATLRTKV